MAEIKCPNCGKTFKVDDSSYADILSQVRGQEFENELHTRLAAAEKQAKIDRELALTKQESAQAKKIAELEAQLKQAETDTYAPIRAKLQEAIRSVGAEHGYAFILNTDGDACPYIDPEMGEDVTDLVNEALR